ncbi:MAG: FKBP-type peptidyl-prolyl cis-trans isomerase, partial [Ilumatobacter sp.]|nr:FKBP-type peptidyl-prolyl cis-trans isomerase [Ilumatobacter sp.]
MPATTSPDKPAVSIPEALPTELVITDLVEGEGEAAQAGDTVTVNYVGVRSEDGTEFDNSYDRGATFDVTLGAGNVIQGWDEGLIGVKKGGRRQLDIPSDLAYGDQANGVIEAGDALTFVIDVVDITFKMRLADEIDTANCPPADGSAEQQREFTEYPPTCIDVTKSYTAEIVT